MTEKETKTIMRNANLQPICNPNGLFLQRKFQHIENNDVTVVFGIPKNDGCNSEKVRKNEKVRKYFVTTNIGVTNI